MTNVANYRTISIITRLSDMEKINIHIYMTYITIFLTKYLDIGRVDFDFFHKVFTQ